MARRHRKRSAGTSSEDEPAWLGDEGEWVEWGGERVWAVDFTSGGVPIGLPESDVLALAREGSGEQGWARALRVLQAVFTSLAQGASVQVGRVRSVGRGMFRAGYVAEVSLHPDPGDRSGDYVVLLALPGADEVAGQRALREAHVLHALASTARPFRAPELIATLPEQGGLALVERFVEGLPLDLRAGRTSGTPPWRIVGELAAQVHACDVAPFVEALRPRTWREHALEAIAPLEGYEEPELVDALGWAREHLPPEEPGRLLHGDLLGQNIRVSWLGEPPALIDWGLVELGDPAADLAVVTRGQRRPFQTDGGLERLLDAYVAAGGAPLEPSAIRVHELATLGKWYDEAVRAGVGTAGQARELQARIGSFVARLAAT